MNFQESLKDLRDNDNFLDVTLVCDDDIQIKAHKNILSVSSNFFRNVLRKNPHPHPLIYLKGVEHSDLLAMVEFMYSGKVEIAHANLDRFLTSAQDLKVKGLFNMQDSSDKNRAKVLDLSKKNEELRKPEEQIYSPIVDKEAATEIIDEFEMTNLYDNMSPNEVEELSLSTPNEDTSEVIKTERFFLKDSPEKINLNEKIVSLIEKKDMVWHCTVCGKTTAKKERIKNHAQTHIDGISVACNICGKVYKSSSVLKVHKVKCRRNSVNENVQE